MRIPTVHPLLLALGLGLAVIGCASSPPTTDSRTFDLGAAAWRQQNYRQALPLLQQAAASGNARAQYAIGYMYYNGQGVRQDMDKALVWIRQAANHGDQRAVSALGIMAGRRTDQPPAAPDADTLERPRVEHKPRGSDAK